MDKQSRHAAIKHIISHRLVGTQEDLRKALKSAGFGITQATLSRDLKDLGVARVNSPEGPKYVIHVESEERRLQSFIGLEIEQVDANESLVVVKTLPGRAQGVAEIIDSLHHPAILGTIAGDNTILVTPTSTKRNKEVMKLLQGLMMKKQVA
ncbi:MAG: arginine repressor [Ignavibacteriales bacterium]|nr:arginine repressor [Ignavibacteriales bacterium]